MTIPSKRGGRGGGESATRLAMPRRQKEEGGADAGALKEFPDAVAAAAARAPAKCRCKSLYTVATRCRRGAALPAASALAAAGSRPQSPEEVHEHLAGANAEHALTPIIRTLFMHRECDEQAPSGGTESASLQWLAGRPPSWEPAWHRRTREWCDIQRPAFSGSSSRHIARLRVHSVPAATRPVMRSTVGTCLDQTVKPFHRPVSVDGVHPTKSTHVITGVEWPVILNLRQAWPGRK